MSLASFDHRSLHIPFKQAFAHASAVRAETESVLVTVTNQDGLAGFGEGCPRGYVTGESVESIQRFVETHKDQWASFGGIEDLKQWAAPHASAIHANPAGWCAVELACLDLFGKEAGQPIEALLGVPPLAGNFSYSAVLGTETIATFEKQLTQYRAMGFTDFKVKVTGRLHDDYAKLARLSELPHVRVRLDANNLWTDAGEAVAYLKQLPGSIAAIEEPLKAHSYEGCRRVSSELGLPVILDESFLRTDQFTSIQSTPSAWIINIRVSKMGGLVRSLAVAQRAKELGIPIVVGAQVGETSLLTRAALTVANAYRDSLVAQEGAFGTHLLERDICQPTLMFGKAGSLSVDGIAAQPGLGLTVSP